MNPLPTTASRRLPGRDRLARAGALAALLATAGCGYVSTHEELGPGRFRLETPYGGSTEYREAVAKLDAASAKLCNGEYHKVNDYDRTSGGPRRLVWEISCKEIPATFRQIKRPSTSDGI